METIKNALSGNSNKTNAPQQTTAPQQTSSGGGWGDKVNSALGGGKSSEAKEDYLDKGRMLLPSFNPGGNRLINAFLC